MPRAVLFCVLVPLLLAAPLRADDAATETVVKLTVAAKPAPKPALRYHLYPELRELQAGNPIGAYLKCFMEQTNFYFNQASIDERERLMTVPLSEFPRGYSGYGASSTRQADYAARLDTPDWQILHKLRTEGYGLLLPEVQQLRRLAEALKVRFRGQIKDGKIDDAIGSAKTMFALARHLGEHPTLIAELVGFAVAHLAFGPLEELLEHPDCPNLYWAFSHLPAPLVSIRKGLQGEVIASSAEFGGLLDSDEPLTDAQLARCVKKMAELLPFLDPQRGKDSKSGLKRLTDRAGDAMAVEAARQRIVARGVHEERVKQFKPMQVVLVDDYRGYLELRDDALKFALLPYWQAEAGYVATEKLHPPGAGGFFEGAVPGMQKFHRSQARVEQRLALLRVVEALRMHAAEHDGKFPAKLDEVKVPLPVDPITGKAFAYKLDGATAVVRGTPPAGMENDRAYNVRYEVTIRK